MSASANKHEFSLSAPEAARLFRNLAEAVESNSDSLLSEYDILFVDSEKLKLSMRKWPGGTFHLKIKTKGNADQQGGDGQTPEPGKRIAYKSLKKRMKESFKILGRSLEAGQAPAPETLAAFLADSREMVSHAGYGDEHYPAYAEACAELEMAVASGEIEAMREAYRNLSGHKSACHARHK